MLFIIIAANIFLTVAGFYLINIAETKFTEYCGVTMIALNVGSILRIIFPS